MNISPPPLKPGDTIGVMAPSSYVEEGDMQASKAMLEKAGYNVFIHPQTYERLNQSAGTELQKALAFQGLWQRKDISAIWCAGGGNRATHWVDAINFERLKKTPKALIGFSDATILLNAVYAHTGIATYHGPMFKHLHSHKDTESALKVLSGEQTSWDLSRAEILQDGEAEGHLIGGNLSLFQYLSHTLPKKFEKNGVLFLEDCAEEYSRVDRMLLHLKRIGVFENVNAIIFGEFRNLKDSGTPYGFSLRDIIQQHIDGLKIPVLLNAPFGHGTHLPTFPLGAKVFLRTDFKMLKML